MRTLPLLLHWLARLFITERNVPLWIEAIREFSKAPEGTIERWAARILYRLSLGAAAGATMRRLWWEAYQDRKALQ